MSKQQRRKANLSEEEQNKIDVNQLLHARTKAFSMDDESYFFRSLVADSRKFCIDKCLIAHNGNNLNHQEKSCLRKCQDVMSYVSLNTYFGMQAALTLDDIIGAADKLSKKLD